METQPPYSVFSLFFCLRDVKLQFLLSWPIDYHDSLLQKNHGDLQNLCRHLSVERVSAGPESQPAGTVDWCPPSSSREYALSSALAGLQLSMSQVEPEDVCCRMCTDCRDLIVQWSKFMVRFQKAQAVLADMQLTSSYSQPGETVLPDVSQVNVKEELVEIPEERVVGRSRAASATLVTIDDTSQEAARVSLWSLVKVCSVTPKLRFVCKSKANKVKRMS